MKKKMIFAVALSLAFASLWACSDDNDGPETETPKNIMLIGDADFENGIVVRDPTMGAIVNVGHIAFGRPRTSTPSWSLSQWASKYDIASAPLRNGENGENSYSNKGKKITRYNDGSIELEIRTQNEYDHPRQYGENWPHLYLEQDFSDNVKKLPLSKYKNFMFRMNGCLKYVTNFMDESTFDPSLHTCHMVMNIYLRNINPNMPTYQSAFLLSIPVWDYRYEYALGSNFIDDSGKDVVTNMFVYGWSGDAVWSAPFKAGEWNSTEFDLMPMIQMGMVYLEQMDGWENVSLEDLAPSGLIVGWESEGTFNASFHIKDLELEAITK